ncbi:MAG: SDR family NAD(P)-dependent oxidoreductase [Deltaproteobacteria bacterium]|nr:SDR family NAD(P)-dependent oxidoreductase [Deltaproteobacteria bacterium]
MSQDALQQCYGDKTIAIVGAAGGIGRELAHQCSQFTDKLLFLGRNVEKLKALSNEIPHSRFFKTDITNETEIRHTIDAIEKEVGPIDISFNLAAVDYFIRFEDMRLEEITETCRINFEGSILYTHAILKKMMQRKMGIIVNACAYSNGNVAFPFFAVDSASRAGFASFYRSLRKELHANYPHIRFVLFSPPPTDTEAERSRDSSKVWKKLKMELHDPKELVSSILFKTARGQDEIMGIPERALWWIDRFSTKLSKLIFMNRYQRFCCQVLDENKIIP